MVASKHHLADIISNEYLAFDYWNSLMKAGVSHYSIGLFEDSEMQMKGSFEIAVIRFKMTNRIIFSEFQIEKPLEFLCSIYSKTSNHNAAKMMRKKYKDCIENSQLQRNLIN